MLFKGGYNYYDTPEGQDIFKKLWYTSKIGAATAVAVATYDIYTVSKPVGVLPTVARYGFYVFPMVGMAAAFTSTTYIATNFRGKDDKLNYFLGGAAAGGVMGTWLKSAGKGLFFSFAFGMFAVLKKYSVEKKWPLLLMPDNTIEWNTFSSWRRDYTYMETLPGNWTKQE